MFVTFYLSAATSGSTVSSTFTITAEPGGHSTTGVSKADLLAGKIIEYPENVTGGTVTATDGTCNGTSATWLVVSSTPTPTPTATAVPGAFGYTTTFGSYPVTSIGSATLTIQNTTSVDKYLWLRSNSAYGTSGTLVGSAAITDSGFEDTVSMSDTVNTQNQTFNSGTYLYFPAGATRTVNVVHTSPSAGSFYLTYTDTNTPTRTNIPTL